MTDFLKGVNLYLIGMMGSGKTTVGKLLATRLGYRFFDTDSLVERVLAQAVGQPVSIAEFFAEHGEAAFRQWEHRVLSEVAAETRSVIATGGGIVLERENWGFLHHGVTMWLDVPVEQLYQRLQADTHRPLLKTNDPIATLRSLSEQRRSLYAQADVRVACLPNEPPEETAERAMVQIQKALKPDATIDLN